MTYDRDCKIQTRFLAVPDTVCLMFICPECGEEVVGKIEDHYRFYPECAKKASANRSGKKFTLAELYKKTHAIVEGMQTNRELQNPLTKGEFVKWLAGKIVDSDWSVLESAGIVVK